MFYGIVFALIIFLITIMSIQISIEFGLYTFLVCSVVFNIYLVLQINKKEKKKEDKS
ncbi:hypothetical protein AWH56_011680 [Anaerobacillus isosaccharinicus]|uniref:Uncharacterized protein n=1 Tax=Anaerobacillus isosaccharinicus TaxID=1532552 RepID=A0A7S7LBX8_9BACI|nr:hypothetical protein [Anaerobacillus isosaccharinicus]MBA5588442.1 hypothetical protein [Anaerobacillus isosaccharinicus]QOY38130.1 hypothetical protein AWH56_011680 [Anaerobacillus isosaccharinicus]